MRKRAMHSYFRIVNELDRLLKSTLTPDQWDARITELAKRIEREHAQAIPLLFKTLRTTADSDLASLIIFVIERMEDPRALEHALEIMRDPSVADEVKVGLLPFLLRHNVSLSSPELVGAFKDPRSISRTLTGWLLDGLAEDEDAIAPIVADLEQWDRDSQQQWLEHFGERGDERALPLLATVAESRDVELARMAIAEIARIPSGRTIFTLENLFNHRETLWGGDRARAAETTGGGIARVPSFHRPRTGAGMLAHSHRRLRESTRAHRPRRRGRPIRRRPLHAERTRGHPRMLQRPRAHPARLPKRGGADAPRDPPGSHQL